MPPIPPMSPPIPPVPSPAEPPVSAPPVLFAPPVLSPPPLPLPPVPFPPLPSALPPDPPLPSGSGSPPHATAKANGNTAKATKGNLLMVLLSSSQGQVFRVRDDPRTWHLENAQLYEKCSTSTQLVDNTPTVRPQVSPLFLPKHESWRNTSHPGQCRVTLPRRPPPTFLEKRPAGPSR